MGGGKADVEISGSPTEPQNDYLPMRDVLDSDFAYFEDGAGEVEIIEEYLDYDGNLFFYQSAYTFADFPGTDGFFGFSNDSTYQNRKNAYVDVLQPGDYYISFSTNKVFSKSDNQYDSYCHMCESQVAYDFLGAQTYHYSDSPEWDVEYNPPFNYITGYFFSGGDTDRIIAQTTGPGYVANIWYYSDDGGKTWTHLTDDSISPKPVVSSYSGAGVLYPRSLGGDNQEITIFAPDRSQNTQQGREWLVWKTGDKGPVNEWDYGPLSNDYIAYYKDKFPGFNPGNHEFFRSCLTDNVFHMGGVGSLMGAFIYKDGGSYPNDPAGGSVTTDFWGLSGLNPLYEWWSLGQSYVEGSLVKHWTGWYEAIVDHISDYSSQPPNASFWREGLVAPGALRFGSYTETPTAPDAPYAMNLMVRPAGGVYDIGKLEPHIVHYQSTWPGPDHDVGFSGPPEALNSADNVRFQVNVDNDTIWDYTSVPNDLSDIMSYATGTLGKTPANMTTKIIGFYFPAPTVFFFAVQYSYRDTNRDYGQNWMHWLEIWKWSSSGDLEGGGYAPEPTTVHYATIDLTGLDEGSGPRRWGMDENANVFTVYDTADDTWMTSLGGTKMLLKMDFNGGQRFLYSNDAGITWDFIYTKPEDGLFYDPDFMWNSISKVPSWEDDYGKEIYVYWLPVQGLPSYLVEDRWGSSYYYYGVIPGDGNEFGQLMTSNQLSQRLLFDSVEVKGRTISVGQDIASEAGFTIRAYHVNSMREKLTDLQRNVQTGGTQSVDFGINIGDDLPHEVQPGIWQGAAGPSGSGFTGNHVRAGDYQKLVDVITDVYNNVADGPGSAFYNEEDMSEYYDLMWSPGYPTPNEENPSETPTENARISIRTLIGMRKIIQSLYASGYFCACFSYCPCQTDIQIDVDVKK